MTRWQPGEQQAFLRRQGEHAPRRLSRVLGSVAIEGRRAAASVWCTAAVFLANHLAQAQTTPAPESPQGAAPATGVGSDSNAGSAPVSGGTSGAASRPKVALPSAAPPVVPETEPPLPAQGSTQESVSLGDEGPPSVNGDVIVEQADASTPGVPPGTTTLPSPQPTPPMGAPVFAPPSPALSQGWSWVDTLPRRPSDEEEPPKRSAFRGSRFDWTHSATTTLLGVGADYQSSAYQVYRQGYTLLLNYFVYDEDALRLRVTTAPGIDVELTNSDITTTQREPWFRDLPVALGVSAPVMQEPSRLLSTYVGGNLVLIAPTSKFSRAAGYYLTVSPRVSVTQQVPLRGPNATLFNDLELWLQVRYDHLFSRAATPVDTDLDRPRRTGGASAPGTLSDVLNGSQIAPNALRIEGSAGVNEVLLGRPLTFTVSADYTAWFLSGVTTGPATPYTDVVEPDPNARTVRRMVGVGLDLTWQVLPAMSVSLGYGNTADLDNFPSNNPFYTPYAAFLAGLVVHVDTVLESIIYRDRQRAPLTRRDLASRGFGPTW